MNSSFCSIAFQSNKWGRDPQIDRPIEEVTQIVADAGYDGVEIWYPHIAAHTDDQRKTLRTTLNRLGLCVPMVSAYYDFTTSDETAADSLARARTVLAHAHQVGGSALRIFTGKTGSSDATPQQWDRAVSSLQQLADEAASLHIRLACETHSRNLMDTLDSSEELIRRIARPNVGLILQPTTFKDDWRSSVERLHPYTFHVHASNSKDGKGSTLDDGMVDWLWILHTLNSHKVDCFVSIEWMGNEPEQLARHEGAWLKKHLGELAKGPNHHA